MRAEPSGTDRRYVYRRVRNLPLCVEEELMATRLERTITVPGQKADVFAYVADFSNAAEWDPGVDSSTRSEDGPLGVGDRYALVVTFGGRSLKTRYETTAYEPTDLVRFEGGTSRFKSIDTITFTEVDAGIEIGYVADFILSFPLNLAEPFLKGRFNALADEALQGLKRVLSG